MSPFRNCLFALMIASAAGAVARAEPAAISDSQAQARSAATAGTDAAATTGAFAIGTPVLDGTGVTVGRITRLTTGKNGQTLVMVRKGVDSFSVPASALHMSGGAAVGDASLARMKAMGEAAQH